MDVAAIPLSLAWALGGWLVTAAILAWAALAAPWRRFASSEAVHVWYGTIFTLVLLWSVRATVADVIVLHLLGTAAFALLAGAPLALIGGAAVVAIATMIHGTPPGNGGLAFLLLVALPVATTTLLLRLVEARLPANYFIYIFAVAFLGGAVSYGLSGIAGAAVIVLATDLRAEVVFGEYVPYLLYLAFGEAFLTGMALTLATVYRPRWVATFDDARYLRD